MLKYLIILPFAFLLCSCALKEDADLVVYNAIIYPAEPSQTIHQAMAIRDGKIIGIGTNRAITKKFKGREMLNAQNKTILPGLIDAHCHFTGYATDMWKCSLVGTRSFEEVLDRVKEYAATAPMHWIYGRGWDQNDWQKQDYPDKTELDLLFPDKPVFLKRIDGHAALVNQVVLDMAGITADTKVNGGSIELKDGKPSGVLIDNAMDLADHLVPALPDSLARKFYLRAQEKCFSLGLTQVQDCGVSEHTVKLLDEAQKSGELKMKVFAFLSDDSTYYDRWIRKGVYKTGKLTVGGFKLYADGALGSRGACLLKHYSDKPGWNGFLLRDKNYLQWVAEQLADTEFQLCTHAIGDSANRQILNTYAAVLKGRNEKRWRIEHAQVVNENDFGLFADYDIIPSVQPTHATSDMYWAGARLGPGRIQTAYAYQRLLQTRGLIALGTDFPVEDISPFNTFYAAVARQDSSGFPDGGFEPANALSREQTLKGMTIWASYAIFEERIKGSLEKNKAADFVIIDTDIMLCDDLRDILRTKVLATYIDGERVYSSEEMPLEPDGNE
jgi:predicted amidohydrolase YtcJ